MVDFVDTRSIAQRAKAIYAERLRETLEREYLHSFVAIEPESGEYFLGKTMGDAIDAAQLAYPDRVTHTIRIGHDVALEIGCLPRSSPVERVLSTNLFPEGNRWFVVGDVHPTGLGGERW